MLLRGFLLCTGGKTVWGRWPSGGACKSIRKSLWNLSFKRGWWLLVLHSASLCFSWYQSKTLTCCQLGAPSGPTVKALLTLAWGCSSLGGFMHLCCPKPRHKKVGRFRLINVYSAPCWGYLRMKGARCLCGMGVSSELLFLTLCQNVWHLSSGQGEGMNIKPAKP